MSSDRSSSPPRYLNVPNPSIHYTSSSFARLKDASTHCLSIATSLLRHRICVFLLHLFILWCFISLSAGMCMPHKSQQGSGSFPSCTTAIREKNVGTLSAPLSGPRYMLLPDILSLGISPPSAPWRRTP